MATQTKESPKRTEPQKTSGVKQVAAKDNVVLVAAFEKIGIE